MLLDGLENLDGIADEDIVVLEIADETPSVRAFCARYPGARRIRLEPGTPVWLEAPRLAATSCEVLVLAQDYRKLKALGLLVRARRRFALLQGRLHPLGRAEAAVGLVPGLTRDLERARAQLDFPRVPPPHGLGNDYSLIEARVSALSEGWPSLTVSVMVPVYNRREVLAKTLAGLVKQSYPRALFEVIVADDGSSDAPESLFSDFPELNIRLVRQEDRGYRLAEVRNLAISASTADVIVSLDCDMIPVPGFLEAHLRWFHGHEAAVATIGYRRFVNANDLLVAEIRRDFGSVERLPATLPATAIRDSVEPGRDWRERLFESTHMLKKHPAPYLLASGGNVAFRRRDALAAGLYHAGFQRWGGEDADFAYRLERQGAYLVPVPGGLAYHQDHPAAAVREEDRKTTQAILGRRVPRLRSYAPETRVEDYEQPRVSVVISAENSGAADLESTLSALRAQHDRDFEVLVFGSVEFEPSLPERGRRVEVEGETVGERWGAAVRASTGEFVLVLRAGDLLGPWFIQRLAAQLERDPSVSMAYRAPAVRGPRSRYSVARHLAGVIEPWPMIFRHRDYVRAGGYDAALGEAAHLDLGLKLSERGLVQSLKEVSAVSGRRPSVTPEERSAVVSRALGRRGLAWRLDEGRLRSNRWDEDWVLRFRLRATASASEVG